MRKGMTIRTVKHCRPRLCSAPLQIRANCSLLHIHLIELALPSVLSHDLACVCTRIILTSNVNQDCGFYERVGGLRGPY